MLAVYALIIDRSTGGFYVKIACYPNFQAEPGHKKTIFAGYVRFKKEYKATDTERVGAVL